MADVDALTHQFDPHIAEHYCIAAILHRRDECRRSLAYGQTCFRSSATTKLTPPNVMMSANPIISSVTISNLQSVSPTDNTNIGKLVISSSPVIFITLPSNAIFDDDQPNIEIQITTVAKILFSE